MSEGFPWCKYFTEGQVEIIEFCLSGYQAFADQFDYNSKPDGYETIAKMAKALNKLSGVEINRIMEGEKAVENEL